MSFINHQDSQIKQYDIIFTLEVEHINIIRYIGGKKLTQSLAYDYNDTVNQYNM